MIWPLIIGFVLVSVAIITAAAVTVNKVAVPFMDARLKYVEARLSHERRILELQLRNAPAPVLPQPETDKKEVEPYRKLAVALVTLTREQLGDNSTRIISRERAQEFDPFKGAKTWERAVEFLTAYGLVYQLFAGGRNEGTAISKGMTAAQLARVIAPLPAYLSV